MKRYIFILLLCPASAAISQVSKLPLSKGAEILFSKVNTKLSSTEKNNIYRLTGLSYSANEFNIDGMPIGTSVHSTDLNRDGKEEIFVVMSGSYFGNTGVTFMLFTPDAKGKMKPQEIGGGIPVIIPSASPGYPAIAVGGPGFTFPLYKWTTTGYKLSGQISNERLSKIGKYLEEY